MLKVQNAQGGRRTTGKKHPVKLTALLYLRDALRKEQYEICADLITTAQEFGASPYEIRDLLEDPRRSPG